MTDKKIQLNVLLSTVEKITLLTLLYFHYKCQINFLCFFLNQRINSNGNKFTLL